MSHILIAELQDLARKLLAESQEDYYSQEQRNDLARAAQRISRCADRLFSVDFNAESPGCSKVVAGVKALDAALKEPSDSMGTLVKRVGLAHDLANELGDAIDRIVEGTPLFRSEGNYNFATHRDDSPAEPARQIPRMQSNDRSPTAPPSSKPRERLAFTAGYPPVIAPEHWLTLLIFLHLPSHSDEVQRRIGRHSRESGRTLESSRITLSAERESQFTIVPRVPGIEFNPQEQVVRWYEDIQELSFRFRTNQEVAEEFLDGAIDVIQNGVLVGHLQISMRVSTDATAADLSSAKQTHSIAGGTAFQSIFVSYAHENSPVINACRAAYKQLGMEMLVDRDSLKSGQDWEKALRALIERADVFQLYWSTQASASVEVEKEWRHALSLKPGKGSLFVRPLYWENPMPAPHDDLGRLHFSYLDLKAFGEVTASDSP